MFAEKLKYLRGIKKITQEELANELSVTKGAIAMWETGKRTPDIDMIKAIATYFDITVDELIGNKEVSISKVSKDIDIRRIQRAKQNMPEDVAESGFDKYFSKDFIDEDTDE
mgnify:CR=1 FL=1